MKNLKEYIIESHSFLVNKKLNNRQNKYEYHPTNRDELKDIIVELLKKGETDLNCIDVSEITDMSRLFSNINKNITVSEIDISEWNVLNVTDMRGMFWSCKNFNSDLSNWNVSNITNMAGMFIDCNEFNSDLTKWDVSNVKNMWSMFYNCKKFNSDLSNWDVTKVGDMEQMFYNCDTLKKNNKIPDWYLN